MNQLVCLSAVFGHIDMSYRSHVKTYSTAVLMALRTKRASFSRLCRRKRTNTTSVKKISDLYHSDERPTVSTGIGDLACQLLAQHAHHLRDLNMYTPCPSCNSGRVVTKDIGKQTGGLIGAAGGVASGAAGALSGAEAGAVLGVVGGPVGIAIGSIAGAILGGLFGGVAGGIAGATLGEQIDEKVLLNYQCLHCGYSFSVNR